MCKRTMYSCEKQHLPAQRPTMTLHIPQRCTRSTASCARMVSVWGRSLCWHVDRCWAQQPSPSSARFAPYAYGCSRRATEETRNRGVIWETEFVRGWWWGRKLARYKRTFIWIFFCSSSIASCWAALRAARRSSRSLQKRHRETMWKDWSCKHNKISHSSNWQLEPRGDQCSQSYL